MYHRFLDFFPEKKTSSSTSTIATRPNDGTSASLIRNIVNSYKDPAVQLKEVAIELSKVSTTNSILTSHKRSVAAPRSTKSSYVVTAGLPAQLLNIGEALDQRKAQNEAEASK